MAIKESPKQEVVINVNSGNIHTSGLLVNKIHTLLTSLKFKNIKVSNIEDPDTLTKLNDSIKSLEVKIVNIDTHSKDKRDSVLANLRGMIRTCVIKIANLETSQQEMIDQRVQLTISSIELRRVHAFLKENEDNITNKGHVIIATFDKYTPTEKTINYGNVAAFLEGVKGFGRGKSIDVICLDPDSAFVSKELNSINLVIKDIYNRIPFSSFADNKTIIDFIYSKIMFGKSNKDFPKEIILLNESDAKLLRNTPALPKIKVYSIQKDLPYLLNVLSDDYLYTKNIAIQPSARHQLVSMGLITSAF